jgi:hypothetical protein
MTPAFSSRTAAAAFAFLLLVILLLPILTGKSGLPPRERIYASAPWSLGAYPYLENQIFEEKGDMDIVFIGSSLEYLGIDTPEVQKRLSEKLGRPAVVRSLCWFWSGFDALYFITQDLLRHRKVKMLIFTDETNANGLHPAADRWFRFGDNWEALKGLPPQAIAAFYAEAILGMPHNLLDLIEPSEPASAFPLRAQNPFERLGSLATEQGLDPKQTFVEYTPQTQATAADVCLYSSTTKDKFQFLSLPFSQLQRHFAQKFIDLAQKNGIKLVFLNLPALSEIRSPTITETEPWPTILGNEITIAGIPPATLFAGITDQDAPKLYYDANHFNRNGQRYFTSIIAPTLIDLYAQNHL